MRKNYRIVLCIWMLALAVQWPHLNRPLSKHHEFNPAIVLICLETWNSNGGPSYSGFCPVFNYTNPGDLFLDQDRDLVIDRQGNQVYVSFGSGFFLYPYWFIKILGLSFTPLSLRLFTLLLGLVSMVLMFHIIRNFFQNDQTEKNKTALLGVILFAINPGFLWYFSNGYDHEIVTIPFFLGAVLVFQIIKQRQVISKKLILVLCIMLMGGIFCDWLNLFTAAYIFFYSLYAVKKHKKWQKLLWPVGFSVLLSIFFCAYPFIQHLGAESYFSMLSTRFRERSILHANGEGLFAHFAKLIGNYATAYASLFIMFIYLAVVNRSSIRLLLSSFKKVDAGVLLLLAIVPFFHHFVFLEFSGRHEYAVIKTLPFLTLVGSFLLFHTGGKYVSITISVFISISVLQFYFINRPGATSWKGDDYYLSKKTGELVKLHAKADEVVFVMDNNMYPQMNYYAKRSTINAGSLMEAKQKLLTKTKSAKGVWLDLHEGKLAGVYHFTINRTTR